MASMLGCSGLRDYITHWVNPSRARLGMAWSTRDFVGLELKRCELGGKKVLEISLAE